MINKQFPSPYDIEQAIRFRTMSSPALRKFTQGFGLVVSGNGKEEIADFFSNLLLEHRDYVELRRLAQGGVPATNISGFTLRATLMPRKIEDLVDDLDKLRTQLDKRTSESTKLGLPIQKLDTPRLENGLIHLKYEYQRVIPGRVELMQRVDSEVNITIEPEGHESQWRIICYPRANQDVIMIQKLFKKLGGGIYEPYMLTLDGFSHTQRTKFFDMVLEHYGSHDEWIFEQVIDITVKQPSPTNSQELVPIEDSDEEDAEMKIEAEEELKIDKAAPNDLLSINEAILHGRNLRTNSFVRSCENQGFYFPSMTLLLSNKKSVEVIEVMIRFKLAPRMFEIILTGMKERQEIGELEILFSNERQLEILREFWDTCHELWNNLFESLPSTDQMLQLTFTTPGNNGKS